MLGSSIGALVGLELTTRHGGQVRTLVAHEPPALHLLPHAERAEAVRTHEEIEEAYRCGGVPAAVPKMLAMVGVPSGAGPVGGGRGPSEQQTSDTAFFLTHDFPAVRRYRVDVSALAATVARIVPAAGRSSDHLVDHRCAVELATRLGVEVTRLPGGHGGLVTHPQECAAVLRDVFI